MKRIVIACDGTWKRADSSAPTNVVKLAQAVLPAGPDGVAQVVQHLDGVGSGRGLTLLGRAADRLGGGMFGLGLMGALEAGYRFLALNHAPGDEIHLFGYSRGAFTARSLAGLIRTCGIVGRDHLAAIPEALRLYRSRRPAAGPESPAALAFRACNAILTRTAPGEDRYRAARGLPEGTRLAIAYLGVWDTVGALGVPGHLRLAARINRGLAFHDTRLAPIVAAARHAVAIDETRRSFPPTLWDNLDELNAGADPERYRQRWFPGDHASVGGGGPVSLLSNDALHWIADGAMRAGLALDPAAVAGWAEARDCRAPLRARGAVAPGTIERLLRLRACCRDGPADPRDLAEAAIRRWRADPGYRPGSLRRIARLLQ